MMGIKKILLLALLSIVALSVGWLELCGLPLLVALVPIFYLRAKFIEQGASRKKLTATVALIFAAWNAATVWWVANATVMGGVAAVLIGMFLPTTVFMCYDYVARRSSKLLSYTFFVVLWICVENLYMNGQLAFPWLMLGNGFANTVWAVQWYEYIGSYGGTLWVLLSNIFIYEALLERRNKMLVATSVTVVVLPMLVSLVMWTNYQIPQGRQAKVHIIQPNFEPYTQKFTIPQSEQTQIMISLAEQAPADVDFIVTPETAFEDRLWEGSMQQSPSMQSIIASLRDNFPAAKFIAGATTLRRYTSEAEASATARAMGTTGFFYDVYNAAIVVDTTATMPVHHKSKLVVGVERIPYFSLLKNIEFLSVELGGIAGQLGYDTTPKIFESEKGRFATPICYESIYGEYLADFTQRGAELIFVITNDGWWGNTAGHRQHFSFSRLRAIETRRAVVRSANTGISGVISPRGDVVESLGWDKRGTITSLVPMNSEVTLYARIGDVVVRISKFILTLMLLLMALEAVKKRIKNKK